METFTWEYFQRSEPVRYSADCSLSSRQTRILSTFLQANSSNFITGYRCLLSFPFIVLSHIYFTLTSYSKTTITVNTLKPHYLTFAENDGSSQCLAESGQQVNHFAVSRFYDVL